MHWDAHNGKWVSSELPAKDVVTLAPEPISPSRRRAVSPGRSAVSAAVSMPLPSATSLPARRRTAGPVDEPASTPVDDPDLPGWRILQRTTNTGRSYKVYHGPSGEYAESKRQAVLLASGQPLSAAQLAFKSKPAPRQNGGGGSSLVPAASAAAHSVNGGASSAAGRSAGAAGGGAAGADEGAGSSTSA